MDRLERLIQLEKYKRNNVMFAGISIGILITALTINPTGFIITKIANLINILIQTWIYHRHKMKQELIARGIDA